MNKNIFNYLVIGLVVIVFSTCSKDDTTRSVITKVPFNIESVDPSVTLPEQSRVVTVNFQLDADQIVNTAVQVAVDPLKSTATPGEDFVFETTIVEIPNYVRKGSFQYEILEDLDAEGDENITFVLSGVQEPFGAYNTKEYNVVIKDSMYSTLNLTFDWDGTFEYLGDTYPICGNVDMDVYVLDDQGNDLGIYDAATGACPEVMIVDESWDDGTYYLATNMYENGLDSLFLNVPYPITVTAVKGGVFKESFVPEDIWTSEDEDFVNDGNGGFKELMILEKSGTTYTVRDADGTLVAQGYTTPSTPNAAGKQPQMNNNSLTQ